MRKEPVFKCPKCGAKPTELIEVGVNVDVINLKGEILFPVGEQAGFFFCPKCDGEISRLVQADAGVQKAVGCIPQDVDNVLSVFESVDDEGVFSDMVSLLPYLISSFREVKRR